MSEESKALVGRVWDELFNQRKLAVADELVAPNFVNHASPPGSPTGPENIKAAVTILTTAFPDHHMAVEDMIAEGDKVVCRTTLSGTHQGAFQGIPATGKQFKQSQIHILRFANGKLAEHWAVRDDLGMMQQLGVIPAPGQGGG